MKRAKKIRYAVVGAGHIAQVAVLPAFQHAAKNSELSAIVSGDKVKHKVLSKKYRVPCFSYEEYDGLLKSGDIDAVYIALPNHRHCDYTLRAANAKIHILCEKPMAINEAECQKMIDAAAQNKVKLMIAYRLHFDPANMRAVELAKSGKIGDLRIFNSVFSMQVRKNNIRLEEEMGGGPLYDIGIYCINAARYLFQDEPYEVYAIQATKDDPRFREVEEMTTAVLRFPKQRLAALTASFGASDISAFQLVGTQGDIRLDPAYEYAEPLTLHLTIKGKKHTRSYPLKDQFAPELIAFSNSILTDKKPEPSGEEGLIDVKIIEALKKSSAQGGRPVSLKYLFKKQERPEQTQAMKRPAVRKPSLIHAEAASGGP